MSYIKNKLSSDSVLERILFTTIIFIILFYSITIISYFFLPEGLMKNKNPLQSWETSSNTFRLTLQIFFYNMLSVLMIAFGSLFGQKKEGERNYISIGYLGFFSIICMNAVVLGTWSFSMAGAAVPLLERIVQSFNLVHRAGLWEMFGQLLITCAVARIATILSCGKVTITRKLRDIRLSRAEKIVLAFGFALMLAGAVIESLAINT